MAEYKGFDILDYLVLIVKWKKFLLITFISSLILSYLAVYLLIEEKYDSTAIIIPAENNDLSSISSLMKSFSNLPVSIPGLSGTESTTDIYTTIIYSRTSILDIINQFDLSKDYNSDNIDETIKSVRKDIGADENNQGAYEITIRANSREKSAAMVNYLVDKLNETLIKLNTTKAKENRLFLESRYKEIKTNLLNSQDSLVKYQKKSGLFFGEEQAKLSAEAYNKLESENISKQIELSILEKIYGINSVQYQKVKITSDEINDKINKIEKGENKNGIILPIKDLPKKAMDYLRIFGEVEINKTLLEFIVPLYEQSKFEEQKSIPYIQIIDRAIPPIKKSYPQRSLFAVLISLSFIFFLISFLILKEKINNSNNEKVKYISDNIFRL